ncbi:MAG: response regulator [Planctomycetes bacterium]|nr:response regulator [Planctomycetota bacterium]
MESSKVVLVAEDDPATQNLIEVMLRGLGVDGVIAPDVESAIVCLDTVLFDLVMVDRHLAGRSGADVLRHHRAKELVCPALGMSEQWTDATRAEMLGLGCATLIDKPFPLESFMQVVGKMVGVRAPEGSGREDSGKWPAADTQMATVAAAATTTSRT